MANLKFTDHNEHYGYRVGKSLRKRKVMTKRLAFKLARRKDLTPSMYFGGIIPEEKRGYSDNRNRTSELVKLMGNWKNK